MGMKHRKYIAVILFAALMWTAGGLAVHAADPSYSGYLDPVTNDPIGSSFSASSYDGTVILSEKMYFDWKSRCFIYPLSDSQAEIKSTAGDGMVLNDSVTVIASDVNLLVFRNGMEYEGELTEIAEPGEYVVSVTQNGDVRKVFSFTIVGETTSGLYVFTPPDGFYITAVSIDGNRVDSQRYVLDLSAEGEYDVAYDCYSTNLSYRFHTKIDRTPPQIELKGKQDADGRFHSAVTVLGLSRDDTVVLTRGGEEIPFNVKADEPIRESGNYVMRVFDAAGNESQYFFTILMYFNAGSVIFFLLVLLSVGGLIAYIIIRRGKLRIG